MNKIILLLTILIFSGCATSRRCALKFPCPVASKDSVYIEKIKKIPIQMPGDTVNIEVPINCPDQDILSSENSKLKQQLSIVKGKIQVRTIIKPDTILVPVTNYITKTKEVRVTAPVKFIPKFWKIVGWTGIIFVILLVIMIILRIKGLLKLKI